MVLTYRFGSSKGMALPIIAPLPIIIIIIIIISTAASSMRECSHDLDRSRHRSTSRGAPRSYPAHAQHPRQSRMRCAACLHGRSGWVLARRLGGCFV